MSSSDPVGLELSCSHRTAETSAVLGRWLQCGKCAIKILQVRWVPARLHRTWCCRATRSGRLDAKPQASPGTRTELGQGRNILYHICSQHCSTPLSHSYTESSTPLSLPTRVLHTHLSPKSSISDLHIHLCPHLSSIPESSEST